ncbi:MAG: hypothetical protein GTN65_00200, partial [Armatimonadetes bacterium]|nr:hypothetical protein [Armatimonadota bacterium]NIO95544.1 hypothetical protein [Armatimonadota bacterium]
MLENVNGCYPGEDLKPGRNLSGVFFREMTREALVEAVNFSRGLEFDSDFIRSNTLRFSREAFR